MLDPEDADLEQAWISHPYTQGLRRKAAKQRAAAFDSLKSACRVSQDPKVVTAFAHWEHWLKLEQHCAGKEVKDAG